MSYDLWRTRDDNEPGHPEPEEDEPEWEFYSGPFTSLEVAIMFVRVFDAIDPLLKYGVWPDPATATKWIIKRTPK